MPVGKPNAVNNMYLSKIFVIITILGSLQSVFDFWSKWLLDLALFIFEFFLITSF